FLSLSLEEIAQSVEVDPGLQSRITTAMDRTPAVASAKVSFVRRWIRLALPLTASAVVFAIAVFLAGHVFFPRHMPRLSAARTEPAAHPRAVGFDLSY